MVREKIGKIGDVIFVGNESGSACAAPEVIVGHDAAGSPETIPYDIAIDPSQAEGYLGLARYPRVIEKLSALAVVASR